MSRGSNPVSEQLLQNILFPSVSNVSGQWNLTAKLSNIDVLTVNTLIASTVNANNITGPYASNFGDATTLDLKLGVNGWFGTYTSNTVTANTAYGVGIFYITSDHGNVVSNVIIGAKACYTATNIDKCVIIGSTTCYQASGSSASIFIGEQAGLAAKSANQSIFIGQFAGAYATGNNNVCIGPYKSGYDVSGDSNIILGSCVGYASMSDTFVVGHNNTVSKNLIVGNLKSGWLGINKYPTTYLDVSGTAQFGNTVIGGIQNGHSVNITTGSAPSIFGLAGTGQIGIGIDPSSNLDVSGTVRFNNSKSLVTIGVDPSYGLSVSGTAGFNTSKSLVTIGVDPSYGLSVSGTAGFSNNGAIVSLCPSSNCAINASGSVFLNTSTVATISGGTITRNAGILVLEYAEAPLSGFNTYYNVSFPASSCVLTVLDSQGVYSTPQTVNPAPMFRANVFGSSLTTFSCSLHVVEYNISGSVNDKIYLNYVIF